MTTTGHFDFVVAGNGILGLSTAFELVEAQPGARVAVIGPAKPVGAASRAAAAMLGCYGEVTRSAMESAEGQQKLRLDRSAAKQWPRWLERINEYRAAPSVSIHRGTFIILNARSGTLDDLNFDAIIGALHANGEPFEAVAPSSIQGMLPVDDSRATRALYIDDEGSVPATPLLDALAAVLARSRGVTLVHDEVISGIVHAGRIEGAVLRSGATLSTPCLILAAGCACQHILDATLDASAIPRILAGVGCSLVLEQPEVPIRHVVRTPNRSFACGLHVVPWPDDQLYVGATNNIYLTPEKLPILSDVLFLLECVLDQINHTLQSRHIVVTQIGNRPVPVDTFPLVGRTSVTGLWILTGTYRDGFHLSPLLAQSIVAQMSGQPVAPDLQVFRPERRLLQPMTKEQAIRQASLYYGAVGFEHGIKIPKVGWEEMLQDMLQKKVRSLYDDLDSDIVLHPDLVSLVDQDRPKMVPFFRNYLQHMSRIA